MAKEKSVKPKKVTYARLADNGLVLEIIKSDKELEDIFHPDVAKLFVEVPDKTSPQDFIFDGKNIGKDPDDGTILVDGKWVPDEAAEAEKKQSQARREARERLNDLSKIKDDEVREVLSDLILCLLK